MGFGGPDYTAFENKWLKNVILYSSSGGLWLPAAPGQQLMVASLPVVIASDQSNVGVAINNTPEVKLTDGSDDWAIDVNGNGMVSLGTGLASTTGGLSIHRILSVANTTGVLVAAGVGQVYGWYLYNANAAVRYLKIYNKAIAPTVGTDVPVLTIPIPPGSAANVEFTCGISFALGIGTGITTGVADNDTGAPAANEIIANLLYVSD